MNHTRTIIFFLSLFSIVSCLDHKKTISTTEIVINDEDKELIYFLLNDTKPNYPGASIMVIKDGEIQYENNYGLANVEKKIQASSETIYKTTSISKQFSAMALMLLIHKGQLEYTTKLSEIFPDFPKYGKHINMRHLMTHQSGLLSYYDFVGENRKVPLLNKEILERLEHTDSTQFFPGSKFSYNQSGYALIPEIVEKVTGRTFTSFMKVEVFEKLNMNNTFIFDIDKPLNNRALGYSIRNDSIISNDESFTSSIQGSKGVCTSLLDYYKWDQALYSNKLIPLEKLEEAFFNWTDNKKNNKEGYGYGWYVDFENNIKILKHYGTNTGFSSQVNRVPSLNLTVVMFSNRDNNDRTLRYKVDALTSIYSSYEIPMPIEIRMMKYIEQNGLKRGIAFYDEFKNDSRYTHDDRNLSYLGSQYYRMQKLKEAEGLYRKSILERPNYFGGYFGLGRLFKNQGKTKEAIHNYQMVIELGADADEQYIIDYVKSELENLIE